MARLNNLAGLKNKRNEVKEIIRTYFPFLAYHARMRSKVNEMWRGYDSWTRVADRKEPFPPGLLTSPGGRERADLRPRPGRSWGRLKQRGRRALPVLISTAVWAPPHGGMGGAIRRPPESGRHRVA